MPRKSKMSSPLDCGSSDIFRLNLFGEVLSCAPNLPEGSLPKRGSYRCCATGATAPEFDRMSVCCLEIPTRRPCSWRSRCASSRLGPVSLVSTACAVGASTAFEELNAQRTTSSRQAAPCWRPRACALHACGGSSNALQIALIGVDRRDAPLSPPHVNHRPSSCLFEALPVDGGGAGQLRGAWNADGDRVSVGGKGNHRWRGAAG